MLKQKAYKKAALKYHPDRNINNKKEAEEKFKVSLIVYENFKIRDLTTFSRPSLRLTKF